MNCTHKLNVVRSKTKTGILLCHFLSSICALILCLELSEIFVCGFIMCSICVYTNGNI